MRKFLLLIPLILLFSTTATVFAASNNSKQIEVTELKSGETVNRNYFAANERVEVDGTVNGDTYLAGGIVNVDGVVNGDLILAGGEVNITGKISDDVRVAGGNVRISGSVGKSVTVAGGNVELTEGSSVGGSVVAVGGNVILEGPIAKTINAGVGSLTIANTIGGDVEAGVGTLRLTSKASINGKLTYWSDNEASIDTDAKVAGEVSRQTPPVRFDRENRELIFGVLTFFALVVKLINLVSWFVLGLVAIHFFPRLFGRSIENLKTKPWPSLGIGFLTLILVPIAAVAAMIFVVGIPLGLIAMALWLIAIYFAKLPVIYFIGEWLMVRMDRPVHQVWALIVGLILYGVITVLPFIGALVGLFATLFGLGAWLLAKKDTYTEASAKKII